MVLKKFFSKTKIPYKINRFGSMISVFFTKEDVVDFASSCKADQERFKKYFHGMLKEGIYLPPSGFESYFLNDALSYEDLDKTIAAGISAVSPPIRAQPDSSQPWAMPLITSVARATSSLPQAK